jgi:hypothetical protein
MTRKLKQKQVRGWLPKEPQVRMSVYTSMSRKRKVTLIVGASAVLVCGFFLLSVILTVVNPIYPTDTKIIDTLNQNKESLLGISSVVGAGIARNSTDSHIIGIAVYTANNATDTQDIPKTLGDFTVIIKSINEASQLEKEQMIIRKEDTQ